MQILNLVLQKLEKDKDKLYGEIAMLKDIIKTIKEQLNESLEMEKKLKNVIERIETEIQKKDKTILQVINDYFNVLSIRIFIIQLSFLKRKYANKSYFLLKFYKSPKKLFICKHN